MNKFTQALAAVATAAIVLISLNTMQTAANWYDYGNGKVNMNEISYLGSKMEMFIKYPDGHKVEIITGAATRTNLALAKIKLSEAAPGWSSISSSAHVKLDMFTIRMPTLADYGMTLGGNEDVIELLTRWVEEYEKVAAQTR